MSEQKEPVSFEVSYTLDVITLLDLLLSGERTEDLEIIHYWEEQLSTGCEVALNKIRKTLPKGESLVSLLIPLITADIEFNELSLTELLKSPKYLVTQFKQQVVGQTISKSYQKFLNKDLERIIEPVKSVIKELERAKFKNYWLENRLPLINQKLKTHLKVTHDLKVIETLNEISLLQQHKRRCIYVVSFDFIELKYLPLFNHDLVVSTKLSTQQILECITEQFLFPIMIHKQIKRCIRTLKLEKDIERLLKQAKENYHDLGSYLEANVKLAYQTYLNEQLGICEKPYEYLGRYQFGVYKISVFFYHYIKANPKLNSDSVTDYLIKVVEEVELNQIDQRFITLMNQVL